MSAPVLVLQLAALFRWEQHQPGGCRCLCGLYHRETPGPFGASGCTAAGEPGLLLRVEAPGESSEPLPVCRSCYGILARLADASEHDC
ncbi:DUF6372 family protein [Streptomyces sp. NPDC037389]|uniref:DUF6372 family protein n=1 Tax=Streptomyces sp. NPDC037389 TaxID=3155369 RepID=UPI0034010075